MRLQRSKLFSIRMSKNTIAGSIALAALAGTVLLFSLGDNEGATLVFGAVTASLAWMHGYSSK